MFDKLLRISTALVATAALVVACGGGDPTANALGGDSSQPVERYAVSGSVSGLETGNPVTLEINGVEAVSVSADGNYKFPSTVPAGTTYSVVIKAQPFWQWCTVENGSGSVAAEVNNIKVQCKAALAKVETVLDTGDLSQPMGIVGDGQSAIFVSDRANCNIHKIDASGAISLFTGSPSGAENECGSADGAKEVARFSQPYGLAFDGQGNLLVADEGNYKIRSVAPDGSVQVLVGKGSFGYADDTALDAYLGIVEHLAVNAAGEVLFADAYFSTLRKAFMKDGTLTVSTIAGDNGHSGTTDGTADEARFREPGGVAVDSQGNVFITDYSADTIRKLDTQGMVTTVAGTHTGLDGESYADGTGTAALFDGPSGITIDAVGNLYVADLRNHRVRRITPSGVVTTLAGSGTVGSADGNGTNALFTSPFGIYVDAQGVLWVTDSGKQNIRKLTPIAPDA